jgi:hypothetical protein
VCEADPLRFSGGAFRYLIEDADAAWHLEIGRELGGEGVDILLGRLGFEHLKSIIA